MRKSLSALGALAAGPRDRPVKLFINRKRQMKVGNLTADGPAPAFVDIIGLPFAYGPPY